MKALKFDDYAAYIGIDWADKKHDVCEIAKDSQEPIYSVIPSKPEALHKWALDLKKRYPKQPIAIACELSKGPLIYALSKYDHLTLYTINPSTVAKYRSAFTPSGAKSDPDDAFLQTEILIKHHDKLNPIQPESTDIRILSQLLEYRRKLVQSRVDLTNEISAYLKNYYPQVLDWFEEKDSMIFCNFIDKWSSLPEVKRARKQTLITFFNEHNSRYPSRNEQRFQEIKNSVALTEDKGAIIPNQIMVKALIPQLRQINESIKTLNKEIKSIYKTLDDRKIFDSLPGAGEQLAPRILVAFGSDRSRYSTAADLQKFAGIAPVIEASGKKSWTHWRYSCPKFLRQTFVEWAGQSIRYSFWAKAYYDQQIAKGKPHNNAIRSLAFKWIRIVFSCWKTKTPYDESKYLEALKRRGSPLLKNAVAS